MAETFYISSVCGSQMITSK